MRKRTPFLRGHWISHTSTLQPITFWVSFFFSTFVPQHFTMTHLQPQDLACLAVKPNANAAVHGFDDKKSVNVQLLQMSSQTL